MSLSHRERRLMQVGGIASAVIILVTWVAVPLAREWRRLAQELEPQRKLAAALEERQARRQLLLSRRARLSRLIGTLVPTVEAGQGPASGPQTAGPAAGADAQAGAPAGASPQSKPAPAFEGELEKAVKSSGGKVKVISARPAPTHGPALRHFRAVILQVESEGDIGSLTRLLHALEKGGRFVRVNSLEVRHDLSKPQAVSVTMEVMAYESVRQT